MLKKCLTVMVCLITALSIIVISVSAATVSLETVATETNNSGCIYSGGILNFNDSALASINSALFGDSVADFEWTFDYIANSDMPWADTSFQFGINGDTTYGLRLHGAAAGANIYGGMLKLVKNEDWNNALASVDTVPLVVGVTYSFKIVVIDKVVKVWYAEKTVGFETEPILTAILDESYVGGVFRIRTYGADFGVSNMSINAPQVIIPPQYDSLLEELAVKTANANCVYTEATDSITINDNPPATVMTKYFGETAVDFDLQFDYKVEEDKPWGDVNICFYGADETEDSYTGFYALRINGTALASSSNVGILQIIRDGNMSEPLAQISDCNFVAGSTYTIRIIVKDNKAYVWCVAKGETITGNALLEVNLDNTYSSGKFKFKAYGAHFTISNLSLKTEDITLPEMSEGGSNTGGNSGDDSEFKTNNIDLSKLPSSFGIVEVTDKGNKLNIIGFKEKTHVTSDTAMTKYFGENSADCDVIFNLTYNFDAPWSDMNLCFRCSPNKEDSYDGFYALRINGSALAESQGVGMLQIIKDGDISKPLAEIKQIPMEVGKTYTIRLKIKDNDVSVWYAREGTFETETPTLTGKLGTDFTTGLMKFKNYGSDVTVSDLYYDTDVLQSEIIQLFTSKNDSSNDQNVNDSKINKIDLSKLPSTFGIVEVTDKGNKLNIIGFKEKSHLTPDTAMTKYFGENSADGDVIFNLTYNFDAPWSDMNLCFRCSPNKEDSYDGFYALRINGSALAESQGVGMLQIIKDGDISKPLAEIKQIPMEVGKTYTIRLKIKDNNVSVWYVEKGESVVGSPTLTGKLSNEFVSGFMKFKGYGSDVTVSNLYYDTENLPNDILNIYGKISSPQTGDTSNIIPIIFIAIISLLSCSILIKINN